MGECFGTGMGSIFLVVEIFPGGEDVAVQNYFTTLKMSQKTTCAPLAL